MFFSLADFSFRPDFTPDYIHSREGGREGGRRKGRKESGLIMLEHIMY